MGFLASVVPWNLGLMLVHMWIYCSTHRPSLTDDVSVMVVMYLALSAFLLALFAGVRRLGCDSAFPAGRTARMADLAAASAMAVCGVLLSVDVPLPDAVTVVAASALGGVGVGWAYLRWCQFYAYLDIHYAAPLVFLTMALGSVGKTVIDYLPAWPAAVALACCPFLTFWCARRSLAGVQPAVDAGSVGLSPASAFAPITTTATQPARYYNGRTVGTLARLALGVAVFSVTTGLVQSLFLEHLPSQYHPSVLVHHGGEVLVALAMLAWVGVLGRRLDFSRTWRLVLVLMGTALVFAPYLDPALLGYLLSLVRTAQTFLIVFLFLALADIARHSVYHPMAVFALGWTAYSLPFMAGKAAGDAMVRAGFDATVVIAAGVWALVMATLFALDQSSAGNHLIFAELNECIGGDDEDSPARRAAAVQGELDRALMAVGAHGTAGTDDPSGAGRPAVAPDPLIARCDRLARDFELTPREREILELLARGRSKVNIAEGFMISENTVRGHVKRIYAKLGVHGKQELLDLVEAAETTM